MRKATIFIVVALLLTLCSVPVYAADMPPLPHAFYGDLTLNGSAAPAGTRVEARGERVEAGTYNPITTTEAGKYGSADPLGAKLIVQGNISGETAITFYVNGTSTGQTYPFDSGETTELPLSVSITAPPPPPPPTVETTLFGIEGSFPISDEGVIEEEIVATSEDENVTITITAGTIALLEGEPLETLTAAVEPSPPEPPEGTYLMGAYDFGPDGATFDPPLTLTWSYDPETVPEGMDLVIAYYDEVAEEWVWVPCEVDTENNIITASIAHFTTFAIIATIRPPEEEEIAPPEEEEVAPPEEEEIAPPEEEEVAPPEEEEVAPPEEEEVAPPEEEIAPPSGINWAMIGGIIGGVILVGLGVFFFVRRRREY